MNKATRMHGSKKINMHYSVYDVDGKIIDTWSCSSKESESAANLKRMQHAVGGYIELFHTISKDNISIYGNEEGLIHKLPPNKRFPPFVGNILVQIKR